MAEVFEFLNLAGGMMLESQASVLRTHSYAVIAHDNQALSSFLRLDHDASGLRVQGIFQQLLHYRGRALHNLAGCDLVGQNVGKKANPCHRRHYSLRQ
jgi:hypothetical protein